MAAHRGKFLFGTKIKDLKSEGLDVELSVYGIFDTGKVFWKYYVISHIPILSNGGLPTFRLTADICTCSTMGCPSFDSISSYGKLFKTKEEGIAYIQEFKDKWEFGSNDTRQEKRDQKLEDVLGDEK